MGTIWPLIKGSEQDGDQRRGFDPGRAVRRSADRLPCLRSGACVGLTCFHQLDRWERLKEQESVVLLFARDAHVSFTNNRTERDLRLSKVKQKVSGCFRKPQLTQAYRRISSYLQTMANREYNTLVAIQLALSGQLCSQTNGSAGEQLSVRQLKTADQNS